VAPRPPRRSRTPQPSPWRRRAVAAVMAIAQSRGGPVVVAAEDDTLGRYLFDGVDADASGALDRAEVETLVADTLALSGLPGFAPSSRRASSALDDRDGARHGAPASLDDVVADADARTALRHLVADVYGEIDVDGDGAVDYAEALAGQARLAETAGAFMASHLPPSEF